MVLVISVLGVAFAICQAISPVVPHAFYGVSFNAAPGTVTRVFPTELPRGMHIAVGDRVVERADGEILRGFRLHVPEAGDTIHVVTADGVVELRVLPGYYPRGDAIGQVLREATEAVVLFFAALLFARRPGWMSFAFWIWALAGLAGADVDYALDWLPRQVGLAFDLLYWGSTYSGLALISFALRFPSGVPSPRLRRVDVAVWLVLCGSVIVGIIRRVLLIEGVADQSVDADLRVAALLMLAAAGILLWRQAHAPPLERSTLAWASTGFVGGAVARALGLFLAAGGNENWRALLILSNLLPLLAIYPILRYRLFDLGFVVSRAALQPR